MNERDIFLAAIEISNSAERAAYVDQACAGNPELRAQVDELLRTHDDTSQFLETPAVATESAVDRTVLTDGSDTDEDSGDGRASGEAEFRKYLEPATRPAWLGRLAHYEIEEILGRGAFGIVAKAFDEKLHRVVAIKLMSPELASTSPPRKRFLREARTAAAVTHENIVAIYAVEEEPIPYLVMEYIPGQTLQQQMDGHGPLEIPDVLRIGQQVASGLAAAHAANLIHRDIKPSNILLSDGPNSRVKISDFGLARAVDDASMTQSGMIAGTPMYMAPEQARGETLDHRADLFSLGSVLYQMAGGRPPFLAPNTVAVLKRVCDDTPRPLSDVLPGTPDWLEAIIFKLLEKDRDDRYQTAQEVADLLARCQRELEDNGKVTCVEVSAGNAATQGFRPQTSTDSGSKKRPLGWLVGGVIAVAAVIGIVLMNGGTETPDPDANASAPTLAEQSDLGQRTDLIRLLDPSRDFLDSRLKVEDGKLITPRFEFPGAVGMIPTGPLPDNYDVELQLERRSNSPGAGFNFGIVVGGRQVAVGMDCGSRVKGRAWGLDWLDDHAGDRKENPTHNPGGRLKVGQTSDVIIQVRSNHITAICDGETLIDWTGDPQRLSVWDQFNVPPSDSLFFVALADFIVHKMELIPRDALITGDSTTWHGWPADAPPPAIAPFDADEARQHQEEWAKHLGVPVEMENSIGMKFRVIPPGEFLMGSSEEEIAKLMEEAGGPVDERILSESPQHRVALSFPFLLGRNEVTFEQFSRFVEATGYETEAQSSGQGGYGLDDNAWVKSPKFVWKNYYDGQESSPDEFPVTNVTWNDAVAFCEWLSEKEEVTYRLPTEAEWEYVCRGGVQGRYGFGDDEVILREYAWKGGGRTPKQVAQKKPNSFGCFDMHGNVWEWCNGPFAKYLNQPSVDPIETVGNTRTIRGGSFIDPASLLRSARRHHQLPHYCHANIGFRIVRTFENYEPNKPEADDSAVAPKPDDN